MSRDRYWLLDLQARLETLREPNDDYVIVSVGVRGPNTDCTKGNAVATVRMGNDTATYEALYLDDAINGARHSILRDRKLREAARQKEKKA